MFLSFISGISDCGSTNFDIENVCDWDIESDFDNDNDVRVTNFLVLVTYPSYLESVTMTATSSTLKVSVRVTVTLKVSVTVTKFFYLLIFYMKFTDLSC